MLTLARDLHPQQIAPARQIRAAIALNQIAAALVEQRLERNEVERAVRRDQQVSAVADKATERAHDGSPRARSDRRRTSLRIGSPKAPRSAPTALSIVSASPRSTPLGGPVRWTT